LASSGKDRRLCIWKQTGQGDQLYTLAAAKDSAHKRIIWSVHFCPFEPSVLASGSRDGNIKIWKLTDADDGMTVHMETIFSFAPHTMNHSQKPDSVTSLAFAPRSIPGASSQGLLALGLESGLMELWSVPIPKSTAGEADTAVQPKLLHCFAPNMCHVATVTKLAWRPRRHEDKEKQTLTLASCSADHGCRIFEIDA
jgi:elongator complex protein 2